MMATKERGHEDWWNTVVIVWVRDKDGSVTSYEPADSEWKNPFANSNYDYAKKIKEIVSGIEHQHSFGQLPEEQYKKKMSFYSRLMQGLAENQASNKKVTE